MGACATASNEATSHAKEMPSHSDQHKPTVRAIPLIVLLCAMAGSIDAVAYLLCGRIFVANMTGGTVLLAISLLQRNLSDAAMRGGLVAAFLAGVVAARFLTQRGHVTKVHRLLVLGVALLLLLFLSWKHAGAHTHALLLLLAGMLGVQNGAFQEIGGIRLNTTFITGDLEKLGEAITTTHPSPLKTSAFFLSWIAYFCGAFLGTVGTRGLPDHGFFIPAILAAAAIVGVCLTPDEL